MPEPPGLAADAGDGVRRLPGARHGDARRRVRADALLPARACSTSGATSRARRRGCRVAGDGDALEPARDAGARQARARAPGSTRRATGRCRSTCSPSTRARSSGVIRLPRRFVVLAVGLLAYQTVAAMVFAGATRYRVPWDFLLALLAARRADRPARAAKAAGVAVRVVHVHRIAGIGGSERHLLTLLPALAAQGLEPAFVGLDAGGDPAPFYAELEPERASPTGATIRAAGSGVRLSAVPARPRPHPPRPRRRLRRGRRRHASRSSRPSTTTIRSGPARSGSSSGC